MAFLKSTPLTFTGIPRLPEITVQSCTSSQVVLGGLLGNILGIKEGPIDADGVLLGSIDGEILTLGLILGTEEGVTDTDG
jgi:hypothetical protein